MRSLKTLTASFVIFAAPQKSTSNSSLPCSSLMLSASLIMQNPALLNTMSTRPNLSNAFSKAARICSGSVTSNERTRSREEYFDRRSESASGLRSVATTLSPCCNACSVTARPNPVDAPVTETNRYDRVISRLGGNSPNQIFVVMGIDGKNGGRRAACIVGNRNSPDSEYSHASSSDHDGPDKCRMGTLNPLTLNEVYRSKLLGHY